MSEVARPDCYYRQLRDGAAARLSDMGINLDQLVYLKCQNVSGTAREEYAILITAIGALYEHLRSHEELPAAQEEAIYAWTLDIGNLNCAVG